MEHEIKALKEEVRELKELIGQLVDLKKEEVEKEGRLLELAEAQHEAMEAAMGGGRPW